MTALPAGWRYAPLMEVVTLHDSKRIPLNAQQRAAKNGPYPYYGANGQVDSVNEYISDGDYILLAEDGGYFDDPSRGVAYEASGKFWVNNHAHILSPQNGIILRYLTYVLNSIDWMPFVGGSTRLKLTQEGMRKVRIPLAPEDEQLRIAMKVDGLFAASRRASEDLEHARKLLVRLKEECLTTSFVDTRQTNATQWTETPLGALITEGPTNGYSPKSGNGATGTLTLKLTATTRGELNLSAKATKRIDENITSNSKYWLEPGDILIQRANSIDYVGATAIYEGPRNTYIYPDLMMRIRVSNPSVGRYLWRYLNSRKARAYFRRNATGTAGNMPKINSAVVRNLPVRLPPVSLIAEINDLIDGRLEAIAVVEQEQQKASAQIKRLERKIIEKAMQGELISRM